MQESVRPWPLGVCARDEIERECSQIKAGAIAPAFPLKVALANKLLTAVCQLSRRRKRQGSCNLQSMKMAGDLFAGLLGLIQLRV